MKWYLADVIEHLFITACAISGHAGGCWLLSSSPLRRVYWWAVNVRWNDDTPQHTACPLCRFDRNEYQPKADPLGPSEAAIEAGEADIEAGRYRPFRSRIMDITSNSVETAFSDKVQVFSLHYRA